MSTWWIPTLGISAGMALAALIPEAPASPVGPVAEPSAQVERMAPVEPVDDVEGLAARPAWLDDTAGPRSPCDGGDADAIDVIQTVAAELASQHILYQSQPLSDCSGMAHRVLGALTERCEGVDSPTAGAARSSRDLAHWYADASLLVPVAETADLDRWLTPGAVLFFGRGGREAPSLDQRLDRVVHVGIVVDVERDEQGRVQRYAMFHGRNPGLPASITRWHLRSNSPSLGNGAEQVVALAFAHPDLAQMAPILSERNGLAQPQDAIADDLTAQELLDGDLQGADDRADW